MNYKVLLLSLLAVSPVCAKNDKILDMIRRIDPYGLNELHIPGFFIKADEKKRYETAAKEVTDKAYRSLHSIALYDFVRLIKGTMKGAAGLGALYAVYLYSFGRTNSEGKTVIYDLAENNLSKDPDVVMPNTWTLIADKGLQWTVYGVLGGLGAYLLHNAKGEFSDIYNKQQRILAYHNALAQEAYIARLPVCNVGACDTVLDE